jgi:MFS transporter, OPA family, glycerol-3-phosphate transporter
MRWPKLRLSSFARLDVAVVALICCASAFALPAFGAGGEGGAEGESLNWLKEIGPIAGLLALITLLISRLPKVDLGHSKAFRRRRVANWLPLGLTYSFLYMGRYNLNVGTSTLKEMGILSTSDFSFIFGVGTVVYGISFLINGPLTDRFGGKFSILMGAIGAATCNMLMGLVLTLGMTDGLLWIYTFLYAANMYFQSFGAVAIVKVNASWFHVRERGVFGAIFGILISLGLYFAFDWSRLIVRLFSDPQWVFYIPAGILFVFAILDKFLVQNTPGEAGQEDFDTADASSGDEGPRLPAPKVFKMMLTNPIVMTIACIEFCSGFLRQAIMQYYPKFAHAVGAVDSFVMQNWGLLLCAAGILGGTVAGVISDHVFGSRRGPVAALLYGCMLAGSIATVFLLESVLIGFLFVFLSLCIIGVHGMLSGTASMDFGGRKNVGIAVGIIDGFVYLGTGVMALTFSVILPEGEAAAERSNWSPWPIAMIPIAIIGLVLATRIWNAMPKAAKKSGGGGH